MYLNLKQMELLQYECVDVGKLGMPPFKRVAALNTGHSYKKYFEPKNRKMLKKCLIRNTADIYKNINSNQMKKFSSKVTVLVCMTMLNGFGSASSLRSAMEDFNLIEIRQLNYKSFLSKRLEGLVELKFLPTRNRQRSKNKKSLQSIDVKIVDTKNKNY